jgi:hypothetical protein
LGRHSRTFQATSLLYIDSSELADFRGLMEFSPGLDNFPPLENGIYGGCSFCFYGLRLKLDEMMKDEWSPTKDGSHIQKGKYYVLVWKCHIQKL